MLWFDVERRYNATQNYYQNHQDKLWFDVERRYNATARSQTNLTTKLWFDVERRYNATKVGVYLLFICCGLM